MPIIAAAVVLNLYFVRHGETTANRLSFPLFLAFIVFVIIHLTSQSSGQEFCKAKVIIH